MKETISEILLGEGVNGIESFIKEEKGLLHRRYIFVLSILFTVMICAIGSIKRNPKVIYKADVEGVKHYTDSLQNFVDTSLYLDVFPKE